MPVASGPGADGADAPYRPIADYALIGDCHGAALVSRAGSIEWACLGRFDADPVFLSLLDAERGGVFDLTPDAPFEAERAYVGETNILTTAFSTSTGQASVRDFMPVGRQPGNGPHDYVCLNAPHWIVRIVEGTTGRVAMRLRYRPSSDFAARRVRLTQAAGRIEASSGPVLYHDGAVAPEISGDLAEAVFEVEAGRRIVFVCAAEAAPAEKEQESYKDQYLRLRADFDNFRKRTRREKEQWTQHCLENLCEDLLTVLDHFDLGLENSRGQELTPETVKGFDLVRSQLGNALGKYGLSPVVVEEGPFDPNLHEAITHLPSPEVPEGHVVAMTRKGYLLGDKLLRPAQVVVSAGEGADDEPSTDAEED